MLPQHAAPGCLASHPDPLIEVEIENEAGLQATSSVLALSRDARVPVAMPGASSSILSIKATFFFPLKTNEWR